MFTRSEWLSTLLPVWLQPWLRLRGDRRGPSAGVRSSFVFFYTFFKTHCLSPCVRQVSKECIGVRDNCYYCCFISVQKGITNCSPLSTGGHKKNEKKKNKNNDQQQQQRCASVFGSSSPLHIIRGSQPRCQHLRLDLQAPC